MMRSVQFMLFCILPAMAHAAEPLVPESVQFPLIAKAMTFDHNLAERCGERVTLCVLYQPSVQASRQCRANFESAVVASGIGTVSGLPFDIEYVVFDSAGAWQDSVAVLDADILYFTPVSNLNAITVRDFAVSQKTLTVGSLSDQVHDGLSLGFTVEKSKPRFLINVVSSRQEGVSFSAQLLKLAIIHDIR
ncbi:MAG: YfiR family protein [bacterium]|nr:YfiR family protein [bacterium]